MMMQDLEPFYTESLDELHREESKRRTEYVLRGTLRRTVSGCGWLLDGVDLMECLDPYHNHELVLKITELDPSPTDNDRRACATCGFPLDEMGCCVRCQWSSVSRTRQRLQSLFREIDRIVDQSWDNPHA
jgi:hypothetical protein